LTDKTQFNTFSVTSSSWTKMIGTVEWYSFGFGPRYWRTAIFYFSRKDESVDGKSSPDAYPLVENIRYYLNRSWTSPHLFIKILSYL